MLIMTRYSFLSISIILDNGEPTLQKIHRSPNLSANLQCQSVKLSSGLQICFVIIWNIKIFRKETPQALKLYPLKIVVHCVVLTYWRLKAPPNKWYLLGASVSHFNWWAKGQWKLLGFGWANTTNVTMPVMKKWADRFIVFPKYWICKYY